MEGQTSASEKGSLKALMFAWTRKAVSAAGHACLREKRLPGRGRANAEAALTQVSVCGQWLRMGGPVSPGSDSLRKCSQEEALRE